MAKTLIDNVSGPTAVDLFAGAGGLAEGFRLEGFQTLYANDHEKPALATFKRNHPDVPVSDCDIEELDAEKIRDDLGLHPGDLDVLAGGPPCQGFSTYGQRNPDDERNRLFEHYLRFLEAFRPKAFVIENVIGILSMQGGKIIQEISERLHDEGYTVRVSTLEARQFGVPQCRKRVFIYGAHESIQVPEPEPTHTENGAADDGDALLFDAPPHREQTPTVREAIADLPVQALPPRETHVALEYDEQAGLSEYARWVRNGAKSLTHHSAKRILGIRRVRLALLKPGDYGAHLRDRLYNDGLPDSVIDELFDGHGSMRDINECRTQDRKKEQQLRELLRSGHVTVDRLFELIGARGFANKYRRLEWDRPSHTLVAHMARDCSDFVHPELGRFITVREAARLQSFQDTYYFEGSQFQQFRQIGNAVPPLLGAALARSIKGALDLSPAPAATGTP